MTGEVVNMASFSNNMKVNDVFGKQFKQYVTSSFLLENIKTKPARVKPGGRTMEVSFQTRGNTSYGNQNELEPISPPDQIGAALGNCSVHTMTARWQISLQTLLSSKGDKLAWVDARMENMDSLIKNFAQHLSRQLHADGTACLARVKTVTADTPSAGYVTYVLEPDQGANADRSFSTKYMARGMPISGSATKTGQTIERTDRPRVFSIDRLNDTIICDGVTGVGDIVGESGAGVGDGDYLFYGPPDRPSKGRAPMGIMGYVNDGTDTPIVMGIDRTVAGNEYFQAKYFSGIGTLDLENQIQMAIDEMGIDIDGETDLMLMALKVWRRWANTMRGERRFVTAAETGKYKGGVDMLMWSGRGKAIPITTHRDVPATTIWGLNWDSFFWAELLAPGWLQQFDEKSIFRWVQEYLVWQAVYAQMGNLLCVCPAQNWQLNGVAEAA